MYERVWSGASKISQFFASPRERILFNEERKREKDKEIYIYIEGERERERDEKRLADGSRREK